MRERKPPELAAAIDLGSNSFHMIVARISDGQLHIVDKLRERVRLAAGLNADGGITVEAKERAIACLERFGQRLGHMPGLRVRVVGTNTLRKAKNGAEFRERAGQALGHPVEVISGREEARLIYLGMAQSSEQDEGKRLVVDIGGGSTEVIAGDGFDIIRADSLFMGCVGYSKRFFGDGVLSSANFSKAQLAARLELESLARPYAKIGWDTAVGCSGTAHAIRQIVTLNGWSEELISLKALKRLRKQLIADGHVDALQMEGLHEDRREVIAGGVAILLAVFKALDIDKMRTSTGALREGVIYDLVGRVTREDVRERTIRWFQERYQVDERQTKRVEHSAIWLLKQSAKAWGPADSLDTNLMSWASRLFEIGLALAHTGYHKHGQYLLTHSHMAGFSREEQRAVATLVGGHRRKFRREVFEWIEPKRLERIEQLCVLFRLAVCLNRSRDPEPLPCALTIKDRRLQLGLEADSAFEHPLTLAALEQESRYLQSIGYELRLPSDLGRKSRPPS